MKVLILGGTKFIGRHIAERLCLDKSIDLTLFNRNISSPELFSDVNTIKGDRNTDDIKQIVKSHWDFVIDCCCYFPHSLSLTLANLKVKPINYLLISSCSVYEHEAIKMRERIEDSPLMGCSVKQSVLANDETYGNRKAECERLLIRSGFNYTIFRPALVYGEYDYSDRLYFWIYHIQNSKNLVIPENGTRKFSMTYVGDIAQSAYKNLFTIKKNQVLNLVSTPQASICEINNVLEKVLGKSGTKLDFTQKELKNAGIDEWSDLPLWLASDFYTYSNKKMIQHFGFVPTNLSDGVRRTLESIQKTNLFRKPISGLSYNELLKRLKV